MRLFLLLAVLLPPLPALAAYWSQIGREGGYTYDMDLDSNTLLGGGHHRIWFKKFVEKRVDGKFVPPTTFVYILVEFSCSGEFRMLERDEYDGKEWSQSKEITDWQYILPATKEAYAEQKLCQK